MANGAAAAAVAVGGVVPQQSRTALAGIGAVCLPERTHIYASNPLGKRLRACRHGGIDRTAGVGACHDAAAALGPLYLLGTLMVQRPNPPLRFVTRTRLSYTK